MYSFRISTPIGMLTAEVGGDAVYSLYLGGRDAGEQSGTPDELVMAERLTSELSEYFGGKRTSFDLPLSPRGTDFQRSVWSEMQKIPYASVMTYGDLAKAANRPKAARAVGSACNKNRILILIPCHRVVSSSGFGGFAIGTEIKEFLLDLERKNK